MALPKHDRPRRQSPILGTLETKSPEDIRRAFLQISDVIDQPIAFAIVTAGVLSAGSRVLTIQVKDRRAYDLPGRWLVLLYAATAPTNAPDAAPTFGTPSTGELVQTCTDGPLFEYLTDENGTLVLALAAVADARVMACVRGQMYPSQTLGF